MKTRTDIVASNVFISWTGADREIKNNIVDYLTQKGISCLESDRSCSGAFEEWCIQAVESCSVFLLVLTQNTFNSEYVKLELEEAKKLDDFKNRIVPVCSNLELYQKGFGGLNEFCSAVVMEDEKLTENVLNQIYEKVNSLLINRLYYVYREKVNPTFMRLIPLWSGIDISETSDVSFEKAYIKRIITEYNDDTALDSHFEPTTLIENGNISFLCGPGGCGKTQYLNYITSCVDNDTLPFMVSCEKFSESCESLFSYLYNQFYNCIVRYHSYSESNFSRLISSKKLILMFDGMDEIASVSAIRNFVSEINNFYNSFNNEIALIFTSRNKRDADTIVLNGKKPTKYYINALSEEEIFELSKNLFFLFDNAYNGEEFFVKIKDVSLEIRSNPLLLTQLAIVYNCSGTIPKTTYEILNAVTDIILKIDDEKGLLNNDLLKNLRSILKKFSKEKYNLITAGRNVETIKIFKHILKKDYIDYEAKAEFLVEYLKNRAILVNGEFYHKMFLEFFTAVAYYEQVFNDYDEIENLDELNELFSHYTDQYWSSVIELFLVKADSEIDNQTTIELYNTIANSENVYDYTLLFDSCEKLVRFKNKAQTTIVKEILYKSIEKIYPPYGPLFYYVPEYLLYRQVIDAVIELKDCVEIDVFRNALALVRDVCFIFGHFNSVKDVCDEVDGIELYKIVEHRLFGIRKALCELFYTGKTDFEGGENIYPRCFNVKEAKSFMECGQGDCRRMTESFYDELVLYRPENANLFNGELIGFIACPYKKYKVENLFNKYPSKKVLGIAFSPTESDVFTYLSIYRKKLRVIYFPENCTAHKFDYKIHLTLDMEVFWTEKHLMYIRNATRIILPGEIEEVPGGLLKDFKALESLTISEGISKIHNDAFKGCSKLSSVEFPNSLLYDELLFSLPKTLKKVVVPNFMVNDFINLIGVERVDFKYDYSEQKTAIVIKERCSIIEYQGRDDVVKVKVKDKHMKESLFENCVNLKDVKLPSNIEEIPKRTFYGCLSLVNIMMPMHMHTVGESAFEGCSSLWRVYLPPSTKNIMRCAFKDCTSLKKVFFPNSIKSIYDKAFMNCKSMEYLHIPPHIEYLSPTAFHGCDSLKKIDIPVNLEHQITFPDNVEINYYYPSKDHYSAMDSEKESRVNEFVDKYLLENGCLDLSGLCLWNGMTFKETTVISSLYLGEGMVQVPKKCFWGCSNLETIVFSSTIAYVNASSFENCFKLAEIVFPSNLICIKDYAFRNCTALKNVTFGKKVLSIGKSAFWGCSSIEKLALPKAIRRIGKSAFAGCTGLKSIEISANFEDDIKNIFGDVDRSIIKFI